MDNSYKNMKLEDILRKVDGIITKSWFKISLKFNLSCTIDKCDNIVR